MVSSKRILYPSLQKFYSALSSLERFEKGQDFFENISHLDTFFSEYRNITFVMQKSLSKTEYKNIYSKYRDVYLKNKTCKWLLDKRNEITKESPFELEKQVKVTIYNSINSVEVLNQIFTIDNDVPYSSLKDSLKSLFRRINQIEVYFSVEFLFFDRKNKVQLYENLIDGIQNMNLFLKSMNEAINSNCPLCEKLQKKIDKLLFVKMPKEFHFIDDYIYYVQKEMFEKAARIYLSFVESSDMTTYKDSIRLSISSLYDVYKTSVDETNLFKLFLVMHLSIFNLQKSLMPTIMIVYDDDTYEMTSFHTTVKTTYYRKINEITNRIASDEINSIFFVTEMLNYSSNEVFNKDLIERIKNKISESLGFFMINQDLNCKSVFFEINKAEDILFKKLELNRLKIYNEPPNFLFPIKNEFIRIKND